MKRLFPSLPETPNLRDVLQTFPGGAALLFQLNDAIMLRDSDLTVGEWEMIAAYVSGLNACSFCFGAHKIAAEAFGMDGDLMEAMIDDPENAPVPEKLKPILTYVACLTRIPARMTEANAQAVYDAGWSEQALYDAVQVCALFNFMNRIVEGTGVAFDFSILVPMTDAEKAKRRKRTYSDIGREIGLL